MTDDILDWGQYEPVAGRVFDATDTEREYVGDGTAWNQRAEPVVHSADFGSLSVGETMNTKYSLITCFAEIERWSQSGTVGDAGVLRTPGCTGVNSADTRTHRRNMMFRLSRVKTALHPQFLSDNSMGYDEQIVIKRGANYHEARSKRETVGVAGVRWVPGGDGDKRGTSRPTHQRKHCSALSCVKTAFEPPFLSDSPNLSDILLAVVRTRSTSHRVL